LFVSHLRGVGSGICKMGEPSVSKSDAPNPEWPMKDRDGYITVFAVCHVARLSAWRSDYCFIRFGDARFGASELERSGRPGSSPVLLRRFGM
jgi:hypothetical protein